MELNQVTVPSRDVERSVEFYRRLGLTPIVHSGPHYARFECRPGGPSFSVHLVESPAPASATTVYFECDDLDARVAALGEQGIVFETPPTDRRWGWREARLLDPDGNRICLYRAGAHRLYPPWRLPHAAPEPGTPFRVERIDHVELFVPGRREAARWYGERLGLRVVDAFAHWADDPGGPLMISSDGGDTKLALFRGTPHGDRETVGFHLVAFRVGAGGFRAFVERLPQLALVDHRGRAVTAELVADHGRALSIYFDDPWGHHLELTTYEVDAAREALAQLT